MSPENKIFTWPPKFESLCLVASLALASALASPPTIEIPAMNDNIELGAAPNLEGYIPHDQQTTADDLPVALK